MAKSPAAILYDINGVAMAVEDGIAVPANTRGFIGVGYDGTYTRFIQVDASGSQVFVGAGVAGTPAGGVVSIQGVSGGQALPVQQGTLPWVVEGTDADGVPPTENPVLVAGWDGTNVQTLKTETDGTLRTRDAFIDDRDKIFIVNFGLEGITATTYYMFIDLDGVSYRHTSGSAIVMTGVTGKGIKSNVGAKWVVQLLVVLRIDGIDADLGVIPVGSVFLRDTSSFVGGGTLITFPVPMDLTISGGDFTKITNGLREDGMTGINTGITIVDVFGASVTPAVGDLLLRASLIAGSGTLDFVYGAAYWVE